MKGTEKIIAHIEADAKTQADAILAEAEAKCADIKAKYEEEASRLYSDRIRDGVKACQDQEDGALRISRMEEYCPWISSWYFRWTEPFASPISHRTPLA